MKKTLLGFALICGLSMSACSNEEAEKEPKKEDKEVVAATKENTPKEENDVAITTSMVDVELNGISFKVPTTYTELERSEIESAQYVLFLIKNQNSFNLVIEDFSDYGQSLSLKEYIDLTKKSTGYEYTSDRYYKANGYEWNEVVSESDGLKLQQSTFVKDNVFYTFTYGAASEEFDRHKDEVQTILSSVTFP